MELKMEEISEYLKKQIADFEKKLMSAKLELLHPLVMELQEFMDWITAWLPRCLNFQMVFMEWL